MAEATTYASRSPRVVSGVAGLSTRAEQHDEGLRKDALYPGGPLMSNYGIDLNWVQGTSPSYSSAAVPQPKPPEDLLLPFTTSTIGAPGTAIFSGFVRDLGEYNPKLDGRNAFWVYEKMRRSDADVKAALLACKLPIRAADKQIVPGVGSNDPGYKFAKEIAEFVRENLFGGLENETSTGAKVSQPFEQIEENALLMLDFGCAAHEDIWTVDGEWIRLRRCAPRLPLTFYRHWTEDDGETLLALEQYGYRKNQFVNVVVPGEKLSYFTHEKEGANFYGLSCLRSAYQAFYLKSQLYRIDAIALERNGMGVPTFTMPEGYSAEDKRTAQSWAQQLVAHESTGLAMPPGWTFEIVGIKGRLRDPWNSIRHYSEQIVKAVLAMFLNLGTTATGSRALGNVMTDFFMLGLQAVARNVGSTISETTIRRLVDFNFNRKDGRPLPYPKLVYQDIVVLNALEVAGALRDLGNAQIDIVQPDDELENLIRRRLGLVPKSNIRPRWMPIQTRIVESPLPGETPTSMESGYQTPGTAGEEVGAAGAITQLSKQGSKGSKGLSGAAGAAQQEADEQDRAGGTEAKPASVPPTTKKAVTEKAKAGTAKVGKAKVSGANADTVAPPAEGIKVGMSEVGGGFGDGFGGLEIGGTIYNLLLSEGGQQTVCVDFHGVIQQRGGPDDGALIPEGKLLVQDLIGKGYRIVILTAAKDLGEVRDFLAAHGVPFDGVTNRKPPALAYIDDRAVPFSRGRSRRKAVRKVKSLEKTKR